jgi:hypothetical protein
MEEAIAPNRAQKPKRTLLEFSKRKLWWTLPPQCQTNFAQASGNHNSWVLNQIQSRCNSFSSLS